LVASSLRQTATRGQLAMMLHTHFRSSRVHVPTLSRAVLNYECKVARAHAKVARAHAWVCRGCYATAIAYVCRTETDFAAFQLLLELHLGLRERLLQPGLSPVSALPLLPLT